MANVKELNINSTTYDIVGKAVEDQNNSGTPVKVWTGTKAEYDLLTPDPNTIYNITDEDVPDNFANKSLSNLDAAGQAVIDEKVNKSGDTMSGKLYVQCSGAAFTTSNADVTKGTNPASTQYGGLYFNDFSNGSDWKNTRIGAVESVVNTDGSTETRLTTSKYVVGDSSQATIWVKETAAGVASCAFPNTDCADGQWTYKYLNVENQVTYSVGTNSATYSLSSYLPNDGKKYEVLISADGNTASTSGAAIILRMQTDIITGNVLVWRAITRSNSSSAGGGAVILPVGTGRSLIRESETTVATTGNCYIRIHAYRRIGDNS